MTLIDPSIGDESTRMTASEGAGHQYALKPGEHLAQCRILKPLGAGGMGEVYLVENIQMHKRYALKVLPPALARDPQFVGRFRVEARVMADLEHPHIVRVHHMGEERGLYYLAMDFIEGYDGEPLTLEDVLRDEGDLPSEARSAKGGRLQPEKVQQIALQICDALEYAHGFRDGVIHRDLKPSNILISETGEVKVSDFGLAKVVGEAYLKSVVEQSISLSIGGQVSLSDTPTTHHDVARARYQRTSTRSILGTYEFMSPEQKAARPVSAASDIYALGMMLYLMLTGEKAEGAFPPPSRYGLSRQWDRVIRKCLQRSPEDRYATVAQLRHDLVATSRSQLPAWGMVAAAALVAGAGLLHWFSREMPASPAPEIAVTIDSRPTVSEPAEELRTVELAISTEPDGALVRIDGVALSDRTPLVLPLEEGERQLEVELNGHLAFHTNIQVELGRPLEDLRILLAPLAGSLRVEANVPQIAQSHFRQTEATLQIGSLSLSGPTLLPFTTNLPPSEYAVQLAVPGYEIMPASTNIAVDPGGSFRLRFEAAPQRAVLHIACNVADAQVLDVRNRLIGTVPGPFMLEAFRTNSLRIRAEGYTDKTITILPMDPGRSFRYREEVVLAQLGPQPGETRSITLDGGQELRLVWCPPGSFLMGSPPREQGRQANEGPQHRVTITRGFWMGMYEVTQGQYEQVMGRNPSYWRSLATNGPVETVSWNAAWEFCRLLQGLLEKDSQWSGRRVRLPTEAEWEYAARLSPTGVVAHIYSGGDRAEVVGWHRGNSRGRPNLVGQRGPNALGFFDMTGNVMEWCMDDMRTYSRGEQTDPRGSESGHRAIRGGSFFHESFDARVARRFRADPEDRFNWLGFRILIE